MRTPSLYNHVRSKRGLLQTIVTSTVEGVLADFHDAVAPNPNPVDRLYHAVLVYAHRHATHRREAIVVNRDTSSLEEPFRTQMQGLRHEHALRGIIADGVEQGRFRAAIA